MNISNDSLKRRLYSAGITRKIDTIVLEIKLKNSFIVFDCVSKTHFSKILYEMIMVHFKHFKIVELSVSESAQASGLKKVEENEVQNSCKA